MSKHGTLLPLPDNAYFHSIVESWPSAYAHLTYPRSAWLKDFEEALRPFYPAASSADRKLTARHYAPFPLALGPNVP